MAELSDLQKQALSKMHYEIVGRHSAVEICSWTKKSILNQGVCYKQKFYGIESHRCCQMSPAVGFCNQKCVFCWRAHEYNKGASMGKSTDDPKTIVDACIIAQRKKLTGFGGNDKANMRKFKEAQEPTQFAISLTGEPTLYSRLPDFIKELHSRGKTTFLVTNGTMPEMLERLGKKNALPTQLYISLDAPTAELHEKIQRPLTDDAWDKLNKTLSILPKLSTRKVIRITLVKGLNDSDIPAYAKLINKASPHFVEVKAYMWLGFSRKRLKETNMPTYEEVRAFSEALASELGWKIIDEQSNSRVCLLAEKDYDWRLLKKEL